MIWCWLAFTAWWACGMVGFVWAWRKEGDLLLTDLPIMAAAGLLGPLIWPIGWLADADREFRPIRLLRRRP
jgi:hypothetical protein